MKAITAGMIRNQKYAKGVTSRATRKVTSSALPSVLRGFPRDTAPTEIITTSAWTTHEATFRTSQLMTGKIA
jgi:hypothetical protein